MQDYFASFAALFFTVYFSNIRGFYFSFITCLISFYTGFNAAVAGCFFAVESVLWPSPDADVSLTNTTSMVILSAVIASVLSEVGLGAEPAFKVPNYDFRSASGKSPFSHNYSGYNATASSMNVSSVSLSFTYKLLEYYK